MVRDKRDIRPVILKLGVALAISLGGIIFNLFRNKRINPCSSSGDKKGELKNDEQTTPVSRNSTIDVPERYEAFSIPKNINESSISIPSTSGRSDGDRGVFLLPEFNELVKEFNFSPRKDVETPVEDVDSPGEYKIVARYEDEQAIKYLKNIVETLKERENTLEIQLLEYYGLKEQETAAMELQNRLKINNMEAKLLSLKIESLKADKMRLEAQVADYSNVVSELEVAKSKIKQLRNKIRFEADHSREHILSLQERVLKLQHQENNPDETVSDAQLKLQNLNELERDAHELRTLNHSLSLENSSLAERLEAVQILTTCVLGDDDIEALKEERARLRRQNEDLVKELEQLQEDRCNDAEELVYIRWINACLRYELRNYQPVPGKIIARDLNKTLSPKSEEKAKQLILEYANKEGQDFDSDWLYSQASIFTDSSEFDDTSIDNSSAHKSDSSRKSKVYGKLMRLVRGKDRHRHHSTEDNAARCSSYSSGYNSDSAAVDAGVVRLRNRSRTSSQCSSGNYLKGIRRYSDVGSLDYMPIHLAERRNNNDLETVQKSELVKYAQVLRGSRSKTPVRKRSTSVTFF